ncbi:MAG: HlyD family efflux transporter periplasmic adaptor subunit [Bacteroidota bacterium]
MEQKVFPYKMIPHNVEHLHAKHHTTTQIIYLTVLLSLLAALVALPYIKVDVTAQSRGLIRSAQDNNAVAAVVAGQVTEVFIKENQKVAAGAVVLKLSTEKLAEQIRLNETKVEENTRYVKDLTLLLSGASTPPSTSLYGQENLQYQQKKAEQTLKINYQQRAYERAKELFDASVIAKVEYEQSLFDLDLTKNALQLLEEQQHKSWELERQNYRSQNRELLSQIAQLQKEKEQYVITAPIDGTISEYAGIQPGNFIAPNQTIARISADDNLIIESYLSPSDIGLIQEGMAVKFQIDAFNYNQWGLATGKVIDISKDIMTQENQPFFKVKCSLSEKNLRLKSGYAGNLKKGMTLTARFIITERSLYQLLYDKMDDWLNPTLG